MAVASRHLCRTLIRSTRPTQRRKHVSQATCSRAIRSFTSSSSRAEDDKSTDISKLVPEPSTDTPSHSPSKSTPTASKPAPKSASTDSKSSSPLSPYMTPQGLSLLQSMPLNARSELSDTLKEYFAQIQSNPLDNPDSSPVTDEDFDHIEMPETDDIVEIPSDVNEARAKRSGYWADDEPDEEFALADDDDQWNEEDITTPAQADLEVHREVREYTRIAAWDLPLLLQYTKPFTVPDMKQTPLRFRYTTYLGEQHPAQSKVVVQFTTAELAQTAGLTPLQRSKFIKLLGPRYTPDKDLAHMSCEKFTGQAQNKRWLGDMIEKLVSESKQGDMFEDVPFDFRHVKPKKEHVFPEGWKRGTEESVKQLVAAREGLLLESGTGSVVDGAKMLEVRVRVAPGVQRARAGVNRQM